MIKLYTETCPWGLHPMYPRACHLSMYGKVEHQESRDRINGLNRERICVEWWPYKQLVLTSRQALTRDNIKHCKVSKKFHLLSWVA